MNVSDSSVLDLNKFIEKANNSMSDKDFSILFYAERIAVIIAISICLAIPPQFVLDAFRSLLTRTGERRSICLLALIFYFIFRNDIEIALVLIAVALGSVLMVARLMIATLDNFFVGEDVKDEDLGDEDEDGEKDENGEKDEDGEKYEDIGKDEDLGDEDGEKFEDIGKDEDLGDEDEEKDENGEKDEDGEKYEDIGKDEDLGDEDGEKDENGEKDEDGEKFEDIGKDEDLGDEDEDGEKDENGEKDEDGEKYEDGEKDDDEIEEDEDGEDDDENEYEDDYHPVFGRYHTLRTIFRRLSLFWIVVNCEPGLNWNLWNGIFHHEFGWRLSGLSLLLSYHAYDFTQNGKMVHSFWRTFTTYLVLIAANEQNLNEEEREKRAFALRVLDVSACIASTVTVLVIVYLYPIVMYVFAAWIGIVFAVKLPFVLIDILKATWKFLCRQLRPTISVHSLPRASAEQLASNDDVCLVCHEEMDTACITPCNHFYHPNCLGEWLERSDTCPMCQRDL